MMLRRDGLVSARTLGRTAFRSMQAGFTLMEMLVVLAITGLAMALLLSSGTSQEGLRLRAATDAVIRNMRDARALAIAQDRITDIRIDRAHATWRLPGQSVYGRLHAGVSAVDLDPASVLGTDGRALLQFFPDGRAAPTMRLILRGGAHASAIEIDATSGRIARAP